MQILNGGSFVNLDSAEKVEQLIFTAKQIAQTATETEGFVNDEATNRQIALDIWQGAEYMTREHEEAQVKNIFVKNFIEELRELKNANQPSDEFAPKAVITVENDSEAQINEPVNSVVETDERDEFLGFVAPTETEERASAAALIDTSPIIVRQETENQTEDFNTNSSESEMTSRSEATMEFESESVAGNSPEEPSPTTENEISAESSPVNSSPIQTVENSDEGKTSEAVKEPVEAIALPEKEPYQFDKCTVTATIQLLPVETDAARRKVVLSVRTHDFAPQISVVETEKEFNGAEILPALEKAFEIYRSNLPLKVMDKLKREKSGAKRQSSASKTTTNTVKDAVTTAESSAQTNNTNAVSVVATPKNETDKAIANVVSIAANIEVKPAAVSNNKSVNPKVRKADDAQPSLFGF